MRVLLVIPARGGSKGIVGKNLKRVGGATLVGRTVLRAREFVARHPEVEADIIVDTDDEAIASEGRVWGADVPFLRESAFSRDDSTTADTLLRLLDRVAGGGRREYDAVLLLQPTSPFRTGEDIEGCWSAVARGAPSAVTVVREGHPLEHALHLDGGGRIRWVSGPPPPRRQDASAVWRPSGSVYAVSVSAFRASRAFIVAGETLGIEQPAERALDVDTPYDLRLAQCAAPIGQHRTIQVRDRRVGADAPCFVIAEAGVNHNGDVAMAHQLVDAAASAGVDAVKFQTFNPDAIASPAAAKASYQRERTGSNESQLDMLRSLALPMAAFRELRDHAASRGIEFLSSPFDDESAQGLVGLGVAALKVPSGELTNHPFIASCAAHDLPLLISTGMSNMTEVADALDVVRRHGNPPVALFHCVSNYPAEAEDCNLLAMDAMRQLFQVPAGWSDHTNGVDISLSAVAMGAELLEKHFTLDRTLPGPDHAASLQPEELADMMRAVRRLEAARGDGIKRPIDSELPLRLAARRSVHASRALLAGSQLAAADLVALRPGGGLSPAEIPRLLGHRVRRHVPALEMLRPDDIEP